jgi:hypothetical protein
MEQLAEDYVNAWVLCNDLRTIAEGTSDPHVRLMAWRAKKHYLTPVDIQLYTPAGDLIEHVNANAVLSGEVDYATFLREQRASRGQ